MKSLYVRESVTDLRMMAPGKKSGFKPVSPERYVKVMQNAVTRQRFTPFGIVCLKCGFVTITNQSYVFRSKKPPVKPKPKPTQENIEELKRKLESHWVK